MAVVACIAAVGDDYIPASLTSIPKTAARHGRECRIFTTRPISGGMDDGTLLPTSSTPRKVRRLITVSCRLFRPSTRRREPLNVAALDGNARGFRDDAPVDNMPYQISVQSKGRRASPLSKPLSFLPPAFPPIQAKREKWFTTRHRLLSYLTCRLCAFDTEGQAGCRSEGQTLPRWPDCPRAFMW